MRQWKKGFTLIELLIVVAIIAILAAIAVPNFLEAQIRAKVSKAKSDMRTLATGMEAYFVDQNTYVPSVVPDAAADVTVNSGLAGTASYTPAAPNTSPSGAKTRITFGTHRPGTADGLAFSMTTPVAYLTSINPDPFGDTRGAAFGYYNFKNAGWLTWSYGPDNDEKTGNGEIQNWLYPLALQVYNNTNAAALDNESVYNPYLTNPSSTLIGGAIVLGTVSSAYTYDSTNGSTSGGDVWRVKQ